LTLVAAEPDDSSMAVEPSGVDALTPRDLEGRVRVHAALADPHRLRIVDALALSDRAPGELASALAIGTSLLAHHVGVLEAAGLVTRMASDGDGRRRYLHLTAPDVPVEAGTMTAERVVFVCTHNTARSQLAAAIWRATSDVPAQSAGTHPADEVHPLAIDAGARAGLDLSDATPRPLDDVGSGPALMVTVCDRAHERLLDLGAPAALHWSIPDPVRAPSDQAFDATVEALSARVDVLRARVVRARVRPPTSRRRHRR
jgi:protein-tyrosine-phosphatase